MPPNRPDTAAFLRHYVRQLFVALLMCVCALSAVAVPATAASPDDDARPEADTASGTSGSRFESDDTDIDDMVLTFSYSTVGRVYIDAMYDYRENRFLLPVMELFSRLEINYTADGPLGLLEGTFLVGGESYRMNFADRTITLGGDTYEYDADRMMVGETEYYLDPEIFREVFDMTFEVNMSTLSARLSTPHTMPVTERRERDQARRNIEERSFERTMHPLRFDRERRLLGGGFADYQISTTGEITDPSRAFLFSALGGAHLLGGALQGNVTGRHTEEGDLSVTTNNLRWRYGLDPNPWLTEILAGQISTQGPQGQRVRGAAVTNEPIESRQLYGTFIVDGRTDPDSEVELFLNNNLLDFAVADQLGYYRFEVPLRYGTSRLQTRVYTPDGELRTRDREIQVPFSFLPRGTASYNVQAGMSENSALAAEDDYIAAHGNVGYGLTRWLTARMGADYSGDVDSEPLVYGSATARLFGSYLINTEFVPNAFYRAQSSIVFPSSRSISLSYTWFDGASRFNRQRAEHQINTSIYTPLPLLNAGFRVGADHLQFDGRSRTRLTSDLFTRVGRINLRLNYRDQLIGEQESYRLTGGQLRASATYSISRNGSIPAPLRGTFLRGSVIYNMEREEIQQTDVQLSRGLGSSGRFTLGVSHVLPTGMTSAQLGLNLDLGGRSRSSTDLRTRSGVHTYRQTLRGSVGVDGSNRYMQISDRQQAGGSAATVTLFVDNSGSGTYEPDEGDEMLPYNAVRLDRSSRSSVGRDGRVRLTQLQSFYRYNLEVNRRAIPNPMLVPAYDSFSFISDPNRYKDIEIPFYRTGVIEGHVFVLSNGEREGRGGLRLHLTGKDNDFKETIRTFHGGGFYAMDIPPGRYTVEVDPVQLDFLGVVAREDNMTFTVEALADGHFLDGLEVVLVPEEELEPDEIPLADREAAKRVEAEIIADLQQAFRYFNEAQENLFNGQFAEARNKVERSLNLFESDHAIALKGSVEYMLGNRDDAVRLWNEANERNPSIPLPDTEILDEILNNNNRDSR